ncbi:Nucleotide-binding universal stress protein, UspA family [Actinopolyspora mzabensis]|uniref:Nucleotide-binding universal stress protein, UspA family n=1 Tax=Actinopolyspora mzabensis TaxID=995066 RepID=A0A1G8XYH9_ACTMZ|nr:universal stress protein [Actinopolyspora mzabensis]SDJ95254.1 Nucleotide-binding universal stress protein, UspA family [Actinopolyspora mzabensis]
MTEETTYRITVGVDGSPASKAALRWAGRQARLTEGEITAVIAWEYPPIYGWEVPNGADLDRDAARTLNAVLAETLGEETSVVSHREVVQGHPARALLDVANETAAALLVVGSRGHGGFTGALLGSVSQHCVAHARTPVVVVRADQHGGSR